MSKTLIKTQTVEWKDLNWRKLERVTFKLQKRIFQASERGDVKAVRKLQKTLINSWSAKCIAVRRVTQDNQGKNTAGVDGIKSLTPKQRMNLVGRLKLTNKVKPTRRVNIPKPGTTETRPLGIPTINDRALQALVKLALEPEWEAKFEPNSYGFRPGRSCHDAIEAIFLSIRSKSKFVLDADISKCFDRINHKALISKIHTYPTLSRQIQAWLRAGYMDGKELFPKNLSLIRYADDFVIIHEDLNVVKKCQEIIVEWLIDMGLELKPSKTRLTHTLKEIEGNIGFEFLGFHIQQYKVGNYKCAKNPYGKLLGFKTLITPSKTKTKTHLVKITDVIDTHKNAPQAALIGKLNPIIRGWSNYYSTVISKEIFSKVDHLIYDKLRAWARTRGKGSINKDKYWRTVEDRNWCFSTEDGLELLIHKSTPIVRHTKVKGEASPFNGDWIYWSKRRGEYPETPNRVSKLIKKQKGICSHCGLYFTSTDIVEVDHIKPKSLGGKDTYDNLQLLHKHCHDIKTVHDGSATKSKQLPIVENYDLNPF